MKHRDDCTCRHCRNRLPPIDGLELEPTELEPLRRAARAVYDCAPAGLLRDLIECFPIGHAGTHLAWSYERSRLPELEHALHELADLLRIPEDDRPGRATDAEQDRVDR